MFFSNALFISSLLAVQEPSPVVCSSPSIALNQAREIEESSRELIEKNGFLTDPRPNLFRDFNKECFPYVFENKGNNYNKKMKHMLYSAVNKSYFYSRDKKLLEYYISYLKRPGNSYDKALDFSEKEIRSFTYPEKAKKLVLSSDGKIKQFSNRNEILIISSPYCGFSRRLRTWIEEQKVSIKHRVTWGVKPPLGFTAKDFLTNPSYNGYSILVNIDNWSEIPLWSTPTIYHYSDGKIIKQVVGFTDETKEFLKSLQ